MAGMLYLCATPIGNLKDMSPRVIETLNSVDVIAAEDTRNSIHLLTHFDIHTPMTSYHEYNKVEKADELDARIGFLCTIIIMEVNFLSRILRAYHLFRVLSPELPAFDGLLEFRIHGT